jgi:putative transposase
MVNQSNELAQNNNLQTVTRSLPMRIHLSSNVQSDIILYQMNCSKLIFNKALFCQRTWFSRVLPKIVDFWISRLDVFLLHSSLRDRIIIFNSLVRRKDFSNLNKMLSNVRDSDDKIIYSLLDSASHFIDIKRLIKPVFYDDSDDEKTNYSFDLGLIVDIINAIGINNFTDKYGDLNEYLSVLKKSINTKISNQIKTKENPKRSGKIKGKSKRKKSVKDDVIINKYHLIPSNYLDTDVVNLNVKYQFELEHNKSKKLYQNISEYVCQNTYEGLGSQTAQQTLKKLDKAYQSFFSLTNKNTKANPPNYIKYDYYPLIFQKNSFRIKEIFDHNFKSSKIVKLSIGLNLKATLKKRDKSSGGFLTFKIPKIIEDRTITEIEIVPKNDKSVATVVFKYKIDVKVTHEIDKNSDSLNILSVDFGIINLVTAYSPVLKNPLIYRGSYVKSINSACKKQIEKKIMPKLMKENKKRKSKLTEKIRRKRSDKIKDHFNKVSADIISICEKNNIKEIAIGYNKNWKHKTKMGNKLNDVFYKIPYRTLVNMLFYKGENKGIKIRECNESYTSKCDALSLEEIGYHKKYKGKRTKRGLFQSAVGVLVNADVNGAINIMRKAIYDRPNMVKKLNKEITKHENICNPIVRKVNV